MSINFPLKIIIFSWNINNTNLLKIPLLKKNIDLLIICLQESFLKPKIIFNLNNSFKKLKEFQMGGLRSIIFIKTSLNLLNIKILKIPLGSFYLINKGAHFLTIYNKNIPIFSIINIHLIHKTCDFKKRNKDLKFLLNNFLNKNLKFFSGDFNFRNKNEENILKENGFIENYSNIFTYKYILNSNKIYLGSKFITDRIFYLKESNIFIKQFNVLKNKIYWSSDHRPIFLEFDIKNSLELKSIYKYSFKLILLNYWAEFQNYIFNNYFILLFILLFIFIFYLKIKLK